MKTPLHPLPPLAFLSNSAQRTVSAPVPKDIRSPLQSWTARKLKEGPWAFDPDSDPDAGGGCGSTPMSTNAPAMGEPIRKAMPLLIQPMPIHVPSLLASVQMRGKTVGGRATRAPEKKPFGAVS